MIPDFLGCRNTRILKRAVVFLLIIVPLAVYGAYSLILSILRATGVLS